MPEVPEDTAVIETTPEAQLAPEKPVSVVVEDIVRKDRKRSRSRPVKTTSEPKAADTPKEKPDPNAPWVILWGAKNENNRVIVGCTRCGSRLSFPFKSPVHKAEEAIWNFRQDHLLCKEGEAPKEPEAPAGRPSLPGRH